MFSRLLSHAARLPLAAAALAVATSAYADVPMLMNQQIGIAAYQNTPWTLQKTGTYVPGTSAGVGTVNWAVTATRGTTSSTLAVGGYIDLANATDAPVPLQSVVINLQKPFGVDFITAASDVADASAGDAATVAVVDANLSYEFADTFTESAASGSITFTDAANNPILLNGPVQFVPAASSRRIYFVARYDAAQLNLPVNTPLQIELIVSFGGGFVTPGVSSLSNVAVPPATIVNDTVTLADASVTASGTVTTGAFTGLNQVLAQSGSFPVTVAVDGGLNGGTVCNTANLTSVGATIPFVLDGTSVPLVVIPGVNATASDCQPVPKRDGGPKPISATINSCSQVVTYDASLFTSPNGSIVSATFTPASGTSFPFGTSTVAYTVTDSAGVTATGNLTVNVIDSEAPVITPVAPITIAPAAGGCTANVTYSTTATDCNLASLTFSPASGAAFPTGTSIVTITATDTAGHSSTSTFTVTVTDTVAPSLSAPNIAVSALPGECRARINFGASAADCSPVTLTYSLSSSFSNPIQSGASFPVGTTTVFVKATDAAGNSSTKSFTVTVLDTQAPVIAAPDIVVDNAPGKCSANVPFDVTVTDCSAVTVVYSLVSDCRTTFVNSGASFPVGTTKVYVKATDAYGNTSTDIFTVTVKDTEGPTITSALKDLTLAVDSCHCYATFDYCPSAKDNCGGRVIVTVSPAPSTRLPAGSTTTVTVTAKDSNGNTTTRTFTVTVGNCGKLEQTTFTQGGWGSKPRGNNPGSLLWKYFDSVYPDGLVVGGRYTMKFTSASAVTDAMPMGGTPGPLSRSYVNPRSSNGTVLAGQTIALQLNVDFSARDLFRENGSRLGDLRLARGELAGWTVNQVLALCNQVLGGNTSALPRGVSISDLNGIADAINNNFDNGTSNDGYLKY